MFFSVLSKHFDSLSSIAPHYMLKIGGERWLKSPILSTSCLQINHLPHAITSVKGFDVSISKFGTLSHLSPQYLGLVNMNWNADEWHTTLKNTDKV